jgi:sulfite reductase beta subunit
MAQAQMRRAIECGVPDNQQYMHPLLKKNYGNWKYHDRPRPGVLHHVAHSGDEVWTVRAGTQRQMDVHTIRRLCDIADRFAEGHVRFTIRSNIEFMVSGEGKVAPLISRRAASRSAAPATPCR